MRRLAVSGIISLGILAGACSHNSIEKYSSHPILFGDPVNSVTYEDMRNRKRVRSYEDIGKDGSLDVIYSIFDGARDEIARLSDLNQPEIDERNARRCGRNMDGQHVCAPPYYGRNSSEGVEFQKEFESVKAAYEGQ